MEILKRIQEELLNLANLEITDFALEKESKEYHACQFKLSGNQIIYRNSKITPKKVGQFVTFWKRNGNGPIEAFHENDTFDFYFIAVSKGKNSGYFILPKSILVETGIISTEIKEGKRGFRIYPPWVKPTSAQALRSQKWQTKYFYNISIQTDLKKMKQLF